MLLSVITRTIASCVGNGSLILSSCRGGERDFQVGQYRRLGSVQLRHGRTPVQVNG
jgi:hypothetical protein